MTAIDLEETMPLHDHFRPPLSPAYHWESFQSHWASVLTNELNASLLPEGYYAAPYVKMGVEIEIDVAAFATAGAGDAGAVATQLYAPPRAAFTAPLDFTELDTFEIQIRPQGSARLAAAIGFISPANKDRPGNRRAFIIKCASYLHQGASLIIVDMVTSRRANLHKELMDLLGVDASGLSVGPLCAAAYRTVIRRKKIVLETWIETLALHKRLPALPAWLAADCVIPIDLESSYTETGESLRLPGF